MNPAIKFKNVSLTYKKKNRLFKETEKFEVLKDISFSLMQGESLGVIGKNGSGKSTMLMVMAGLLKPTNGALVNYMSTISLLNLHSGFVEELTGRDNSIFTGMLLGFSKSDIIDKLDKIKEYSELGVYFDQPVRTYSSGMRTRLGFSISTIIDPDILLIDEVLSVGDDKFRKKAENTMYNRFQSGKTIVFVSHSAEQIERLCDRALLLDRGKIIMIGDTRDVINTYNDL